MNPFRPLSRAAAISAAETTVELLKQKRISSSNTPGRRWHAPLAGIAFARGDMAANCRACQAAHGNPAPEAGLMAREDEPALQSERQAGQAAIDDLRRIVGRIGSAGCQFVLWTVDGGGGQIVP